MTTYNATKMAAGVQPRVLPGGAGVSVLSTFLMTVAAKLLTNDLVNMVTLEGDPALSGGGPSMLGVALDCDQIDTGAGVVLALGDATTANRYITGSTIGQAGGYAGPNQGGVLGFQPFSATFAAYPTASLALYTIVLKATTGVTTGQLGTIRVKAEYTYDP